MKCDFWRSNCVSKDFRQAQLNHFCALDTYLQLACLNSVFVVLFCFFLPTGAKCNRVIIFNARRYMLSRKPLFLLFVSIFIEALMSVRGSTISGVNRCFRHSNVICAREKLKISTQCVSDIYSTVFFHKSTR